MTCLAIRKITELFLVVILTLFTACGSDKGVGPDGRQAMHLVKNGVFSANQLTVEEAVNCLLTDPEWSTFRALNGDRYVDVKGFWPALDYIAQIQFLVDEHDESFILYSVDGFRKPSHLDNYLRSLLKACD